MYPPIAQPGGLPPAVGGDQPPPGLLARLGKMFGDEGGGTDTPADPYKDLEGIKKFVEECKKDALENRWVYERSWWRVLLYILGRMWIYYDRRRGQWLDKRMAKWIPRPVTNLVQVALNSIKTVFKAVQLSTTARPLTPDADSVATAETADKLEPLIATEHKMRRVMREFDFWFIALGNGMLHLWWNPEATTKIDQFQSCTRCEEQYTQSDLADLGETPMCQRCGGGEFEPAVNEYGFPMGEKRDIGAGCTDALSPFEWAIKPGFTSVDDAPYIVRMRFREKKDAIKRYGAEATKHVTWGKMPHERSLQLLRAIAHQNDVASTPITYGSDEGGATEGVSEFELWHRPNDIYPHGLVARVLGDSNPVLIEKPEEGLPGPLPFRTQDGTPLFPFVHAVYEDIGGRLTGRGAVDVILNKNDQLNQLDSMAQLCEQRMGNPVWLEPKGAEVKSFTGEPGLVVKYNPNVAGGNAKPERIQGQNVPASFFTRRDQIKADVEELVGTYDLLKGAKPSGVEAFSALNLLKELSESRFGPALEARGEAYRQWYTIALEMERQFGPEERIRAAMRPNKSWTFKKFKKANLSGAIDILVEGGSQLPKTALGKRAAIEHGKQLGVVNAMDPEQAYEIMREIGIAHLAPSLDSSVKGALREQSLFEAWTGTIPPPIEGQPMPLVDPLARQAVQPKPVTMQQPAPATPGGGGGGGGEAGAPAPMQDVTVMVPMPPGEQAMTLFPGNPLRVRAWDKHMVHVVQHDVYCQSDEALDIFAQFPELEELWTLHRQAHLEAAAQEAMQQAMMQAGQMPGASPGAPGAGATASPGAPSQGAARALSNSNQNSHPPAPAAPMSPQAHAVM